MSRSRMKSDFAVLNAVLLTLDEARRIARGIARLRN
jgi:hypothetical protein